MKSLKESLFDKDLVSKELPVERMVKHFDGKSLASLSLEERNSLFDSLFNIGHQCDANELRKTPIDLDKQLIMVRRDGLKILDEYSYPCKFGFVYKDAYGDIIRSILYDYDSGTRYRWDRNNFVEMWRKPTWKGQVSAMYHFYGPPVSFSVIENEKMVKDIIKGIYIG